MTLRNQPTVLVFAGPNGSGKSTVTKAFDIVGIYVNADDIKACGGITDLEAAQEAERIREYCVSNKSNFTFETVLSTDRNLVLLEKARAAGFYVKSVFVTTCDAELNVARVKSRVLRGGHDVPSEKVRSRYKKSLENAHKLFQLSDEFTIIDNSGETPEIIYHADTNRETLYASNQLTDTQIRKILKL